VDVDLPDYRYRYHAHEPTTHVDPGEFKLIAVFEVAHAATPCVSSLGHTPITPDSLVLYHASYGQLTGSSSTSSTRVTVGKRWGISIINGIQRNLDLVPVDH
jgi:hypothetical protein